MNGPVDDAHDEEMLRLLERVRGIEGRRRKRGWMFPSLMIVAFVAVIVALGISGYLDTEWPVLAAILLTFGPGCWLWVRAEQREKRSIEALTTYTDLRVLGGLLDALNSSGRQLRKRVENALLLLLPQLTDEHCNLLNTGNLEVLNALMYSNSGELALAALSSMQHVGNGTALPYLTSMAAGKGIPSPLRQRQTEVQERAQRAADLIRAKIEIQSRASTLLRPYESPDTQGDILLRSANPLAPANPDELLRPDESARRSSDRNDRDRSKEGML